ncbi:MAG TPA: ornithine--oxo-acid transaminase [Casimicrobiaceae bacterium]|nr:ornithine--oxo-acid transaminase [Casimicrobiaceae bacterium]
MKTHIRSGQRADHRSAGLPAPGSSYIDTERRYGAWNYEPLPVVMAHGEGVWLWDEHGRRYLDMLSAYSAVSHGHANPRIVQALIAQAQRLAVTSRAVHTDRLPAFLEKLTKLTGLDRALPVNTGLEAVETALKAARKWGYRVKGIAEGKAEIVVCENNFHGRSITIVGFSSDPQYSDGFGPFAPGFRLVPFGDALALEAAITPQTAAFLVEPIQGEGGIVVPPEGYLAECARICRKHRVQLLVDEIQTGMGRTGRFLACEHEGVRPDGLMLGKALGGGMLPVSAFVATHELMQVFRPGDHGSTFGGNPLAATVALEALEVLFDDRLIERSAESGAHLLEQLRTVKSPLIREIRGKGLFVGLEVDTRRTDARTIVDRLLARGVLSKDTHNTVVRFAPPLYIGRQEIDWAVEQVRAVFADLGEGMRRAA